MNENLLSLLEASLSEIKMTLVPQPPAREEGEVHYLKNEEGRLTLIAESMDFNRIYNHFMEKDYYFKTGRIGKKYCLYY